MKKITTTIRVLCVFVLFAISACNSKSDRYIDGTWALVYLEGIESIDINDGNHWDNGFGIKIHPDKKIIFLQVNTDDTFIAKYSYSSEDSTITVFDCKEDWFNGKYKINLDRSMKRFDGMYTYMLWTNDSTLFEFMR